MAKARLTPDAFVEGDRHPVVLQRQNREFGSRVSRVVWVSLKIAPSSVSSVILSVSKIPRAAYGGAPGCDAMGVMVTGRAKA